MRERLCFAAVLTLALTAGNATAQAGAAPEEAAAMLHDRGYHHIQVDPDARPGYRAYACKQDTHFRIEIDAQGRIVDVEPVGDCDKDVGPKKVQVKAPFFDVKVGENGVHVKVPFVDIRIPRR